jgi:hypothetical protein
MRIKHKKAGCPGSETCQANGGVACRDRSSTLAATAHWIPNFRGPESAPCDGNQSTGHTLRTPLEDGLSNTPGESALLGCAVGGGGILEAEYPVCLRTFLALDDVELNIIALFQRLVAIQLNRGIVNEYIRPIVAPDESIAFGVVKPLDLPFVLSHRLLLSLGLPRIR